MKKVHEQEKAERQELRRLLAEDKLGVSYCSRLLFYMGRDGAGTKYKTETGTEIENGTELNAVLFDVHVHNFFNLAAINEQEF